MALAPAATAIVVRDEPLVVLLGARQQLDELAHRRDVGDRTRWRRAEPTDLALHAALLVTALQGGLAEELEAVLAAERDEAVRFAAVASP